jgi:tRNA (pseudouridine54-N1)-methyltransferase
MREFIYFSSKASTTGNFDDSRLKEAGRMDIVCHFVINSFFVSNAIRPEVRLHLVFYGQPDPPRHIVLEINEKNKEFFSKKDVAGLIKKMLYKYKKGQRVEVFDSCFIERKSFIDVINKLKEDGKVIYLLDKSGENLRDTPLDKDHSVFVLGDHEGIPKQEKKEIEKIAKKISLGNVMYFASQSLTILQNELDLRSK